MVNYMIINDLQLIHKQTNETQHDLMNLIYVNLCG